MGALSNIIKGTTNNIQKPAATPVQTGPVNTKPSTGNLPSTVKNTVAKPSTTAATPKVNITPPSRGEQRAEQRDAKITVPSKSPTKDPGLQQFVQASQSRRESMQKNPLSVSPVVTPRTPVKVEQQRAEKAEQAKAQARETSRNLLGDTSGKSVMDLFSDASRDIPSCPEKPDPWSAKER